MAHLVTLGELLVDFIPWERPGVVADEAKTWRAAPGGAPANVAVGAARLGVSTAFLGKVGDDLFGRMLARTLADEGVGIDGLRFETVARTALAFVSLSDDGERSFHFYRHPSADMLYRPDEVDLEAVRRARILHFGSVSMINEPSRSATLAAVDRARAEGAIVTFDPNLRLDLWPDEGRARAGILDGIRRAQVVKLSEEELAFLTGSPAIESATELGVGLELLVVTRARHGADYLAGGLTGRVDGFETRPVDTTGAGDSFMAALIFGLDRDPQLSRKPEALQEALRRANACAALTVSSHGAIPSLPTTDRLEEFLGRRSARK